MKTALVIALASLLVGAPAFAQNAGEPGATGTGEGLTGSNTGTEGATSMSGHSRGSHHHRRHHHHHHHRHMR